MKQIIFLLVLLFGAATALPVQGPAQSAFSGIIAKKTAAAATQVYICKSKSAYAYHKDTDCRGLGRCTHTIVKVSKETAEEYGYRPCGYCY